MKSNSNDLFKFNLEKESFLVQFVLFYILRGILVCFHARTKFAIVLYYKLYDSLAAWFAYICTFFLQFLHKLDKSDIISSWPSKKSNLILQK